ncbi:MAG: hypothetical protein ACE14T_06495 [Syntrophales bacterium]
MTKKKTDNKNLTPVALALYGLIMLSLILIYRDILITVTAVVIMVVLVLQYIVPVIRERKKSKTRIKLEY